jgi:hypothetical protein
VGLAGFVEVGELGHGDRVTLWVAVVSWQVSVRTVYGCLWVSPHPLRLAKYSKETSYLGTLQSIDSKRFSLKVLIQSDLRTARMRKPRRFAGAFCLSLL